MDVSHQTPKNVNILRYDGRSAASKYNIVNGAVNEKLPELGGYGFGSATKSCRSFWSLEYNQCRRLKKNKRFIDASS